MSVVKKPTKNATVDEGKRISRIVFIALLLDILSFTVILPLLPRSLEAYRQREIASGSHTLLGWLLGLVEQLRHLITARLAGESQLLQHQTGSHADMVLLGGLLGSLYSLLQCLVAPVIGKLADRWGRRRTLLICMMGNILWTVVWIRAQSFEAFLVARIIAGLSEGNVQISNTVIADVTDTKNRSHGMALVGIAFAVGFTLGPSIGAYFALMGNGEGNSSYAPFAGAAMFSLGLLLTETLYLIVKLPETLNFQNTPTKATNTQPKKHSPRRRRLLSKLNWIHFAYLFFFSGMEYTLTFLTHDRFNFSNAQQGKLLGVIGIVSATLQGGYVRRVKGQSAHRDKSLVFQGMLGCTLGLLSIALCCQKNAGGDPSWHLWAGCLGFAVASATVVNCLNSMVSLVCQGISTGQTLGEFRSAGQVGRAFGPMFACSAYWLLGASTCYYIGTVAVGIITVVFAVFIPATLATSSASKKNK